MKDFKKILRQHKFQMFFSPIALVIGLYFILVENELQTGLILVSVFVILVSSQAYAYYTVNKSLQVVKAAYEETSEDIQHFFIRTYNMWHGGDLDYFDPGIKSFANVDFDNFLYNLFPKKNNNDSLDIFIRTCEPIADEFYMGSGNDPTDEEMPAWFLLTNKRYFIRDGITNEITEIALTDIDHMYITDELPATLTVSMHSGVTLMIQQVKRALNPPDLIAIRDAMNEKESKETSM